MEVLRMVIDKQILNDFAEEGRICQVTYDEMIRILRENYPNNQNI